MLGLIYTIFASFGIILNNIKENNINNECKSKYKNKNNLTYIDSKGKTRLLSNDELVFYTKDNNGNFILENEKGDVYHNFSQEDQIDILNKNIYVSKKCHFTTYPTNENCYYIEILCKGQRYIDFNTGEVYVIRYLQGKYYYMNVANGFLVRETDWQLANDISLEKEKNINIEEFNNQQKNRTNKRLLYRNSCYNTLCDFRR